MRLMSMQTMPELRPVRTFSAQDSAVMPYEASVAARIAFSRVWPRSGLSLMTEKARNRSVARYAPHADRAHYASAWPTL